jgi:hypothetical protein
MSAPRQRRLLNCRASDHPPRTAQELTIIMRNEKLAKFATIAATAAAVLVALPSVASVR